jgi:IS30 family transposase
MNSEHQQLQPEERLAIASQHLQGLSIRTTIRILGRSPATVSREFTSIASPDGYACLPGESVQRRSTRQIPHETIYAQKENPSGVRPSTSSRTASCPVIIACDAP